MSEENRKWLERLIKENKDSPNELTYTYCPFEILYQLQQENQQQKNRINSLQRELNDENLKCSKYAIDIQELKIQISAREEEYKKLKHNLLETENWLRPAILQLMEIAKQEYFWITDQQIDNAKLVPIEFTVMGDRSVKFKKLERGIDNE